MSFVDGNGLSAADVAAVTGNNGGFGGFGNDGAWWLLILFLFAGMNGNWGGFGGGRGNGMGVTIQNDMQRGFDQQAIMGGINGLTSAVSNGFANAEISRCNGMTNILQAMNSNQAANTANVNALAMALTQGHNGIQSGIADLKYTVATENCADRNALEAVATRIIANQTAGIQTIVDKMCQQELDTLRAQNAQLNTQLQMANLAASQNAQTGQLMADNAAQTAALLQRLNPAPVPAYCVPNPNGCNCGCNFNQCGNV
jgi:hypothetical protein